MKTLILTMTLLFSFIAQAAPECWKTDTNEIPDGSFIIQYVTQDKSARDLANLIAKLSDDLEIGRSFSYDYGDEPEALEDLFGNGETQVESSMTIFANAKERAGESREERIQRVNSALNQIELDFDVTISCDGLVNALPKLGGHN